MAPSPSSLPFSLLLLLSLSTSLQALSSHSPQDLFAFPRYTVVLKQEGVLNDTVPVLLEEARESASLDSSAHPAAVHLLRTPAGQAFLCTVPAVVDDPQQAEKHEADQLTREAALERGLERGLALLEPMRGGCLYQKQNWFTYSFCYGAEIRQFHEVRLAGSPSPSEDPHADSYTLGQAPEPVSPSPPKYGSGSGLLARKDQRIPASLGGGGGAGLGVGGWDEGGRYLVQRWEDGTVCDKTGMPRTVEVQFHCNTQTIDRIALIRETAICRYILIIHTPRLCSEPVFLEGRETDDTRRGPSNAIECRPVVSKLRAAVDAPAMQEGIEEGRVEREVGEGKEEVVEGKQEGEGEGAEVLTLLYDPQSGAMLSAQNSEGEEVLSESELAGTLASVVGAEGDDEGEEVKMEMKVEELGELARVMRETIGEALRDVAGDRARPNDAAARARAAGEQDAPVVINGVEIRGLADMVAALARSSSSSDDDKDQKRKEQQHPGLHAYNKKLALKRGEQAQKAGAGGEEERLGSEEHEMLRRGWGAVYDTDEKEEEERKRDEL